MTAPAGVHNRGKVGYRSPSNQNVRADRMALPSETDAPRRKTVLGASCATHAIQDGLSAAVYVLLPILAQAFGLSYSQIGLFKGIKSLAQGLLELPSGLASERFGERALLVFGLALAGIGYLYLSIAGSANVVLFSLLVVGIGGAFQHAPASALVSRAHLTGGRRGALGLYNSSGDAGKLLFTGGFSLFIAAGLTWPTVTFVYGACAIVGAACVYVTLGSAGAAKPRLPKSDADGTTDTVVAGWGILDRRGFSALLAAVFLDGMVQAGALTFVAFVMVAKGLPLAIATLAAVALLIGGMCGKAACGFLAERIGVRTAFTIVQALTALGLFAVLIAPSVLAFILLPFVGVVLQGSTSITYGMVDDLVHPDRTPRGYALVYAASSFAGVAGPLGFGLVADSTEIGAAIMAMVAVAALAILPGVLLRVPAQPDAAATSAVHSS